MTWKKKPTTNTKPNEQTALLEGISNLWSELAVQLDFLAEDFISISYCQIQWETRKAWKHQVSAGGDGYQQGYKALPVTKVWIFFPMGWSFKLGAYEEL